MKPNELKVRLGIEKYQNSYIQERFMQRKDKKSEFEERIISKFDTIKIDNYILKIEVSKQSKDFEKKISELQKICKNKNIQLSIMEN